MDRLERLRGRDVLGVGEFAREDIDALFGSAKRMRAIVRERGGTDLLRGKVLALSLIHISEPTRPY